MNNFWNNLARYPHFFINSFIGLLLIILTPFKNLFKKRNLRIFLIVFFLISLGILYKTIIVMTGS